MEAVGSSQERRLEQTTVDHDPESDGHRGHSQYSDDEGWDENSVARGQDLSDYRASYQLLPSTETPSNAETDTGPIPNPPVKHTPRDIRVVVGVDNKEWCGLQNMGNSCYMNAGLQCLCCVPQFASYFLKFGENLKTVEKDALKEDCSNERKNCRAQLSASFIVLLKKLWSGQFSSLYPKAFKLSLGLVYPPFTGSRQQDCQEFLAVLLDHLHEHLMDGHSSANSVAAPPPLQTIVSQIFQGQLKNKVECLRCGHVSMKFEPFVYLSLPLPGAHERKIEVYWVPAIRDSSTHFKVTRVVVTVLKQDSICGLKKAVCELLGLSIDCDLLVTAEVKQGCITKILGNAIAVKQLSMSGGEKVYCYEMLSLSELTAIRHPPDPWSPTAHTQPLDTEVTSENFDAFGSKPFVSGHDMSIGEPTIPDCGKSKVEAVVMEWRTCSVCLEEMLDSDLMVHPECGGVLCSTCLQSSVEHFSQKDKRMACPICSVYVLPSEAFCSLSSRSHPQQEMIISFLQVVLLMRNKEGRLFGHPLIIHLPQEAHGALYYRTISCLLPECLSNLRWSLCLTDGRARYCSRCSFESFCSGCPMLRSTGSVVKLKPGDHVTISFTDPFTSDQLSQANDVADHSSVVNTRHADTTLTLKKCLETFSKSEVLAEDNPWLCSLCKSQQRARRTLTVDSIPSVLIVHLKRFMYHSGGSKLELPVEFPFQLEAEEVCSTLDGERSPLELVALVCHYGTLQGGHYTAFVKKPFDGSWIYCNDSHISQISPSTKEADSAYILFYQHQNDEYGYKSLIGGGYEFDDQSEMKRVEQLMLSSNVKTTPLNQTLLKRTNSDPDMRKKPTFKSNKRQCTMSPF